MVTQLNLLTEDLLRFSKEYYEKRMEAARARKHLFVMLALKQNEARYKNAALDRQLLFLLSDNQGNQMIENMYSEMILAEEAYKGLERIISAYQSKISALQSLMKWGRE